MIDEQFDELRPGAFAIAYRMLGSVTEAEDMVQEGFLRLHRARAGGERIESPRAYLSTVVSRLSLDHLRSAGVRRETYVGEALELLRLLWSGERVRLDGEHYTVSDVVFRPTPVQPRVPIWVGGNWPSGISRPRPLIRFGVRVEDRANSPATDTA